MGGVMDQYWIRSGIGNRLQNADRFVAVPRRSGGNQWERQAVTCRDLLGRTVSLLRRLLHQGPADRSTSSPKHV